MNNNTERSDDDLTPTPALERLARETWAVTRLPYEDVLLALDEGTYRAAHSLRTDGFCDLPNLGRLEIRYGEYGREILFLPSEDLLWTLEHQKPCTCAQLGCGLQDQPPWGQP